MQRLGQIPVFRRTTLELAHRLEVLAHRIDNPDWGLKSEQAIECTNQPGYRRIFRRGAGIHWWSLSGKLEPERRLFRDRHGIKTPSVLQLRNRAALVEKIA